MSLTAATMCQAFQLTARRCADQGALRTRDGATTLTWREYADAVERTAGGLAALGVGARRRRSL